MYQVLILETAPREPKASTEIYSQRFSNLDVTDIVIFLNEMSERKKDETPLGKPFSAEPYTERIYPVALPSNKTDGLF